MKKRSRWSRWKWAGAAAAVGLALASCGPASGTKSAESAADGTQDTGSAADGIQDTESAADGIQDTESAADGTQSAEADRTEEKDAAVPETASGEREEQISWYNEKLEESQVTETFLESLDQFSYRTAAALFSADGEGGESNENYSPLSLYYALGMAASGADGETLEELNELLGTDSREELSKGCRLLYENLFYTQKLQEAAYSREGEKTEEKQPSVSLANSFWADEDLDLKKDYRSLLAEDFYASSYLVDFKEDETWRQMEAWIGEHTGGVMKPQLAEDPQTLLALINTLYYYGAWRDEFPAEETEKDTFYLTDGTESSGDFMHVTVSGTKYKDGDGFQTASLGLRGAGQGDEMVFVLPDEGTSAEELLSSPERLKDALELGDEYRSVSWTVPQFSFGSSIDGNRLLKSLGVNRMFTDLAEFPGISDRKLQVSKVLQETHIGLDEKGVEGAAYTMVTMMETAAPLNPETPVEMRLDRPFLYGIRSGNGAWLFLGIVRDPFAA